MQKATATEVLKSSIMVLKQKQDEEKRLLIEQFTTTTESLKPANILRKMILEIAAPSELKEDLVQTATALISGYISCKLLVRSSRNPILRLAGILVQYSITSFVASNSKTIKAVGLQFLNRFASNRGEPKN